MCTRFSLSFSLLSIFVFSSFTKFWYIIILYTFWKWHQWKLERFFIWSPYSRIIKALALDVYAQTLSSNLQIYGKGWLNCFNINFFIRFILFENNWAFWQAHVTSLRIFQDKKKNQKNKKKKLKICEVRHYPLFITIPYVIWKISF